ncbi:MULTISPECIES: type II toxin-antitoxin system VapC family toxin [unclassified Arthrobacter]|uniref:type II toxin-antitoxin system VapC family toxin n=1 Tax=unclassified Arthrobacter TaxID=235627 RepID=UPI00288B7F10|nr:MULTISPECIES: type II toxin-antitoxin system VapC family toxin [unclassified Arthrobacter]
MPAPSAGCYLDTSSLIRLLTPGHPSRQQLVDLLDEGALWGQLYTSKLTQLEAARVAIRDRNDALAHEVGRFLEQINVVPISDDVLERAMGIPFHVKSLDAIHIASAAAATVILTSDRNMEGVLMQLQQDPASSYLYPFQRIFG